MIIKEKEQDEILPSPDFKKLIRKRWQVSLLLTIVMLGLYFGFILLIAFDKDTLASPILGEITLGIPVGLGIILSAWLLTGVYVYWANTNYDNSVQNIKRKLNK